VNGSRRVYLINGPNLSRLGKREPKVYGSTSLREIEESFSRLASSLGYEAVCIQSDSESEIIKTIHAAIDESAGIVINPGALTHYSYAIADALAQAPGRVVEVHITNPYSREAWRQKSVVSAYVTGTISGFGVTSYLLALRALAAIDGAETPGADSSEHSDWSSRPSNKQAERQMEQDSGGGPA